MPPETEPDELQRDILKAAAKILDKPRPTPQRLSRMDRAAIWAVPVCQIALIVIARSLPHPQLAIAASVIAGTFPVVAFFWFDARNRRKTPPQ